MKLNEVIEKLGLSWVLLTIALGVGVGILYYFLLKSLAVVIISTLVAILGCLYLMAYVVTEPSRPSLEQGERLILRMMDRGVVILPRLSFLSGRAYKDLSIYLTSKRIIATDQLGKQVVEFPLERILGAEEKRRAGIPYLELKLKRPRGMGEERALLFVGDTKLWLNKLKWLEKEGSDLEALRRAVGA